MKRLNNIFLGLIIGLVLPLIIIALYLGRFYDFDSTFFEKFKSLYPSVILGKLFMLSIIPDLLVVFFFYKKDMFRIAGGIMVSAIIYLITSIFMM